MSTVSEEVAKDSVIVEFTQTEAGLAALRDKFKDIPDTTTAQGYEECRVGIRELVSLRTGLDKMRLALNADDQARIKVRNDEAKRITGELVLLETPMKVAKAKIDDALELKREKARKAEEDRMAGIEGRMAEMGRWTAITAAEDQDSIERAFKMLQECHDDFDWEEFSEAAQQERDRVLRHLTGVLEKRNAYDEEQAKLAADREALEKETERQRVINEEAEAKIKKQGEALAKQQAEARAEQDEANRKIQEEREDAARVMKEAQDKAEEVKREEERREQARIEEARKREEEAQNKQVEEKRQEQEKKEAVLRAARLEALKPEIEKAKEWTTDLQGVVGPKGIKDKEIKKIIQTCLNAVSNIAVITRKSLEEL
jgi:hypothetical protein